MRKLLCEVYGETIIHLIIGVNIYLAASWVGEYPPQLTSTSLNDC